MHRHTWRVLPQISHGGIPMMQHSPASSRALWQGTVSFGLATIPVRAYSATADEDLSLCRIHAACGTRVKQPTCCPTCDRQIAGHEIVRGYEHAPEQYITLTEEEIESLPVPTRAVVPIAQFVPAGEINPLQLEGAYYLAPGKGGDRAFALLAHALKVRGLVAVARITLRSRERACVIGYKRGTLVMRTLRTLHEVRDAPMVESPALSALEQEAALALVDMMTAQHLDHELTLDRHQRALQALIESKLSGQEAQEGPRAALLPPAPQEDLMALLRASMLAAQEVTCA